MDIFAPYIFDTFVPRKCPICVKGSRQVVKQMFMFPYNLQWHALHHIASFDAVSTSPLSSDPALTFLHTRGGRQCFLTQKSFQFLVHFFFTEKVKDKIIACTLCMCPCRNRRWPMVLKLRISCIEKYVCESIEYLGHSRVSLAACQN